MHHALKERKARVRLVILRNVYQISHEIDVQMKIKCSENVVEDLHRNKDI